MNAIAIIHTHPDYFALLRGPWTIKTTWHKTNPPLVPKTYQLCHLGIKQRSIPAFPGNAFITPSLGRMVRECVHLNAINASPRPAVQCLADAV